MPKLRVVESGICDAWRGFGRGVERFVGVGAGEAGLRAIAVRLCCSSLP